MMAVRGLIETVMPAQASIHASVRRRDGDVECSTDAVTR